MGNNPVMMVDPDGEFVFLALAVGAAIGGYSGYKIGKSNGASGWGMAGYIAGGALIGGVSGAAGAGIAAGGSFMANTSALAFSSTFNSIGMRALNGGQTPVTTSFGAFSVDWSTGKVNTFSKNNSPLQNLGYALGAMANLQDVFAGLDGAVANVKSRKEIAGHSWMEGKDINISVGPAEDLKEHLRNLPDGKINNLKWETQYFSNTVKGRNFITSYNPKETFSTKLNNVNVTKLQKFTKNLNEGLSLGGKHNLKYGVWNGCVNQTSRALMKAGVFNFNYFLPITSPVLLNAELAMRNYGMLFSHYMIKNK
ncbi:hypothetical protein [Belliella marina]